MPIKIKPVHFSLSHQQASYKKRKKKIGVTVSRLVGNGLKDTKLYTKYASLSGWNKHGEINTARILGPCRENRSQAVGGRGGECLQPGICLSVLM